MKEKWEKKKKENTQKHNHTYKQTNKQNNNRGQPNLQNYWIVMIENSTTDIPPSSYVFLKYVPPFFSIFSLTKFTLSWVVTNFPVR